MKMICVVTGTRAEYGLLRPVMQKIASDKDLELRVVATGMHLCPEFGLTYKEIERDGIIIDEKIEMQLSSDTNVGMTKSTGLAMISFAEYFERKRPDMLIVLGDRFEIFACTASAAMTQIPIAHLYGGDTTEGAIDEFFRHSITKMSYLHFTSTEEYKKRVEQLGEHPNRVFNVGSIGVENILNVELLSKSELEQSIGFVLDRDYALVTYHPPTLEKASAETQFGNVLSALDIFGGMKFIFTKSNSDAEGRVINEMIDHYVSRNGNCTAFASLGLQRYLSAMKHSKMMIGNSSSGLYEAPSFGIPTVNIDDRQKGRLQASSVINCEPLEAQIANAVQEGLKLDCSDTLNPYWHGGSPSQSVVDRIKEFLFEDRIHLNKEFWNVF